MANIILHKRNSTPGTVPTSGALSQGELAINIGDGKLYTKNSGNNIINLGVTSISGTSITPSSGNFSNYLAVDSVPVSVSGHSHTSVPQAQSLVTSVFNKSGSSIPKFSVVYIDGGQGDQPTIKLAIASNEAGSSKTYGVTAEAISNMSSGNVVVAGALSGLNTDQFNPNAPTGDVNGTSLWLSPTVSGSVTTTKPYASNHAVFIGTIVRTHQNAGVVEVRIQNGFELDELHNVAISGVTNNQYLTYNSASGLWVPTSSGIFSTVSTNTIVSPTGYASINGINIGDVYGFGDRSISNPDAYLYISSSNFLGSGNGPVQIDSWIFDGDSLTNTAGTIGTSFIKSAVLTSPYDNYDSLWIGDYTKLEHLYWSIDYNGASNFTSLSINGNSNIVTGTGVANHIAYWNSSSGIVADSGQLYWDATNNRLGVGTSSPSVSLEVGGSIRQTWLGTDLQYAMIYDNSYRMGINYFANQRILNLFSTSNDSGGHLTFSTRLGAGSSSTDYGTERMRITSSGNIGIGTASPSYLLDVNGTIGVSGIARFNNDIYMLDPTKRISWDNGTEYIGRQGDSIIIGTQSTTKILVNSAGNVGIGTQSPSLKLNVNPASDSNDGIQILNNSAGTSARSLLSISNGSYNAEISLGGSGFTNDGFYRQNRLLISGPFITDYVTGQHVFHIGGGGSYQAVSGSTQVGLWDATSLKVTNGIAGGNSAGSSLSLKSTDGVGTTDHIKLLVGNNGATEAMRIINNGNVGIGTTTPGYKLQVAGSFGATTKSFRIDHPSKKGYSLEYGSLESPYHGVRLTGRGKVIKGVGTVDLPDYLKDLIHDDESIVIQLTNYKHGKTLYVSNIDLQNDKFIVKADRAKSFGELEFFWTLTGVRKDVEDLVVEKEN